MFFDITPSQTISTRKNTIIVIKYTLRFYALFIAGLVFFVIDPALEKESIIYAILVGGFFGLITYGTYDLTNLATMKDWPLNITIIDLIWGTVLNALTSGITFTIVQKFFKS